MALNIFKKKDKKDKPAKDIQQDVQQVATPTAESFNLLPNSVLKHPYISEKGTRLQEFNQYVFAVSREANKTEIKKQIARQYKVKVVTVRIVNLPAKSRMIGRFPGSKPGVRKAIVTLAEGEHIEHSA